MDIEGVPAALVDGGAALLWLGANLALIAFSYRTSRALFSAEHLPVQLTAMVTLSLSTILLVVIILGAVNLLFGWLVILFVATISLAGWWFIGRNQPSRPQCQGVSLASHAADRPRSMARGHIWRALWLLGVAFAFAHVVCTGLLQFPSDFDSLMYHLPIIDQWLQAGSLYAPYSSYWWTPGTSEVIGLWLVAPFSGDFLVGLNNTPFAVLWAAGSLALAYELDLSRPVAHVAALASLLTFSTFDELNDAQNDLAIVAFCLAGACFGLRYVKHERTADLVFFSMSVGALCGVKYNALGYAALLIVAIVGASGILRGAAIKSARGLLGSAVGILLLSAYWYGRNWIIGTSPIYPMGLGHDIATTYPNVWSTTFVGNGDAQVPRLSLEALWKTTGPVHLVAVLATPFLATYVVFRGIAGKTRRLASVFLSILLPGTACLLMVTPFCLEDQPGTLNHLRWAYTPARYGLCFLSIAVHSLLFVVSDLWQLQFSGRRRIREYLIRLPGSSVLARLLCCRRIDSPGVIVLVALVVWQAVLRLDYTWNHLQNVEAFLTALNIVVLASIVAWASPRLSHWVNSVATIIISLVLTASIAVLSDRWHNGYGAFYDELFRTTIFGDARRWEPHWDAPICVLELRAYPFFGSRRQTRILRPRVVPSPEWLAGFLQNQHVRLVATRAGSGQGYYLYTDVFDWLQRDQQRYVPIINSGHYSVYSVNQSAGLVTRPRPDST